MPDFYGIYGYDNLRQHQWSPRRRHRQYKLDSGATYSSSHHHGARQTLSQLQNQFELLHEEDPLRHLDPLNEIVIGNESIYELK